MCFSCTTIARRNRKRSFSASTGEQVAPVISATAAAITTTAAITSPLEVLAQAVVAVASTKPNTGMQDTSMTAATLIPSALTTSSAPTLAVESQTVATLTAVSASVSPQIAAAAVYISPVDSTNAPKDAATSVSDCQPSAYSTVEYDNTDTKPFSQLKDYTQSSASMLETSSKLDIRSNQEDPIV